MGLEGPWREGGKERRTRADDEGDGDVEVQADHNMNITIGDSHAGSSSAQDNRAR